MDELRIRTAQNVGIEVEVAGIGDRLLAALVDYLLIYAYAFVALLIAMAGESWWAFLALIAPLPFYFLLCEVFMDGQSVGKAVRRIKVVRDDGRQPTLADYFLRWLLRFVDITLTSGLAAVVAILVSEQNKRLGDLVAGTVVVRTTSRARLSDTIYARLEEDYTPVFPQAERLTNAEVETAREVLQVLAAGGRTSAGFRLGRKTKEAFERKLGVASDLPPEQFLRTLVKDYNHVRGRV